MKLWVTEIQAICPIDGELKTFCGPSVPAPTKQLAYEHCQNNGLGYCRVIGQLVAEIPCRENSFAPDWGKILDYENAQKN